MHYTPKDYYSDMGHNLVKVFGNRSLPTFIKNATQSSQEELDALPDSAFVDKTARRLPIHTPEDTYISAVYEIRCNGADSDRMEQISKAASFWGIEKEVKSIPKEASVPTEAPNKKWALDYGTSNGLMVSARGEGEESLIKAAEAFCRSDIYDMPFTDRVKTGLHFIHEYSKICENKIAAMADLPYELTAMSCVNLPNHEKVCEHIYARSAHVQDKTASAALVALAEDIERSENRTLSGYRKLAETLDEFDEKNGLRYLYKKAFPNPHETVFNTTMNEVSSSCKVAHIAGEAYSYDELSRVPNEVIELASSTGEKINGNDKVAFIMSLSPLEQSSLVGYLDHYTE